MTWLQVIVMIAAGLGILVFLLAVYGLLTVDSPSYMPMSPDEEYRMLTEHYGLTHDEAEEVMDDSWRDRL